MSDQIKITDTLAKLDKEMGGRAEAYVLGLPGNKRLTFEDFTSWTGEKAARSEEILKIASGETNADLDEFAQKWLNEEDYEKWVEQGFSIRQKARILQRASTHVLRDLSLGESDASSNS